MALAQTIYCVAQVLSIQEASGLPATDNGNPRVVAFQLEPNANRAVCGIAVAMDRNLAGGLNTGDLVRLEISPAQASDEATFESAVGADTGLHVVAG